MLNELAAIIKPEFPDVSVIQGDMFERGTLTALEWNYSEDTESFEPGKIVRSCNRLSIDADPLTSALVVIGGESESIISKESWGSRRSNLENAIVKAYRKPVRAPSLADFFTENFISLA